MKDEEYRKKMGSIFRDLAALPDHSKEAVDAAAHQLEGMNADLSVGKLEIDASTLGKEDVRKILNDLELMDFDELMETRNIEKPFDDSYSREEWCNCARINRAELLMRQFSLLSRLRSDIPEAWDKVNELYFDD